MMRTKVTVHCDGPNCGRQANVPPRHVTGAHNLVEAIPGWIAVALQDREEWWEETRRTMRTFCSTACLSDYERDLAAIIKEETDAAFAAQEARSRNAYLEEEADARRMDQTVEQTEPDWA